MSVVWGIILIGLSMLCWAGQTLAWFAPSTAVRFGLVERQDDVDPVYWADVRGEALWDALTLWTMVAAGVLLVADSGAWPYFGLVGGGMYLYFAGRGVFTRLEMQRRKLGIGTPSSVHVAYVFLTTWGVMAAITVVAAARSLA